MVKCHLCSTSIEAIFILCLQGGENFHALKERCHVTCSLLAFFNVNAKLFAADVGKMLSRIALANCSKMFLRRSLALTWVRCQQRRKEWQRISLEPFSMLFFDKILSWGQGRARHLPDASSFGYVSFMVGCFPKGFPFAVAVWKPKVWLGIFWLFDVMSISAKTKKMSRQISPAEFCGMCLQGIHTFCVASGCFDIHSGTRSSCLRYSHCPPDLAILRDVLDTVTFPWIFGKFRGFLDHLHKCGFLQLVKSGHCQTLLRKKRVRTKCCLFRHKNREVQ